MTRKTFLTLVAVVGTAIGTFTLIAPTLFLASVKFAAPSTAADVMTRTVGVLLVSISLLNFLVRGDGDSPTMKSVLVVNLVLQLGIAPIDPIAYAGGVFMTLGSFLPNTIAHVLFAAGFAYHLAKMKRTPIGATATDGRTEATR